MKLTNTRTLAVAALIVLVPGALFIPSPAQSKSEPQSPYGGTPVEEIVVRVNDQIITRSDYDRAVQQLDNEGRQQGAPESEIEARKKDMLRDLIDQQLLISKAKELGITGETELIHRLDEIRKQNHLDTMEDLEKAAKEQGVSYEDFKANIRNGIITQQVVRDEVGRHLQLNPGELQAYYDLHKSEMAQPESVTLSEILISTAIPGLSAADRAKSGASPNDAAALTAAKAKAEDVEAKLKAGASFDQLAKAMSDGPTAKQGGRLGDFKRGMLAKVIEDKAFALQAGQHTDPIRTKQGYLILEVTAHNVGGTPAYKDVEPQIEEAVYMQKMQPALREYLKTLREQAYIDMKPGFVDTGASPNQTKPIYSAYTPPAPKKKKQVERTRFREKAGTGKTLLVADTTVKKPATLNASKPSPKPVETMKPGKREKIRFGQAPRETLPNSTETQKEDAGALPTTTADNAAQPANPLEPTAVKKPKTRFTVHSHDPKVKKPADPFAQPQATAAEVAAQQTQSAPLGLGGNQPAKKKKDVAESGEKTRLSDQKKPAATAPAPAPAPPATPQQ